jgi:hypothetical protein
MQEINAQLAFPEGRSGTGGAIILTVAAVIPAFPEGGGLSRASHSEPTRAPFSATERFINNTANATTNVSTADIQKTSK